MQFGDQVAVGGIGRRIRQGHAGQRIQVAQAAARQFQAQVQGTEVQRVGQGAGQGDAGVRDLDLGLQRERLGRVLQGQQATDLARAREFLAVVLAFDLEAERVVLGRRAFFQGLLGIGIADDFTEGDRLAQRVDDHIQLGLEALIVKGHMAFVEADGANIHHPIGRFGVGVLGVELERPVGAAIRQALQLGTGFGEVDARDHHTLHQQGQGRNAQLNLLERDHLRLFRPIGVTQSQVFGNHMGPRHPGAPAAFIGLTLPHHGEVAVDGERTMQFFGDLGIEGRLDAVPVEEHQHQYHDGNQQNEAGAAPSENFTSARHCTGLLNTTGWATAF